MSVAAPSRKDSTAILILAAGGSTRLGQAKQRVRFRGVPLLVHTVTQACNVGCSVFVVLGAEAITNQELLKSFDVSVVIDRDWNLGMGHSLKWGLQHLLLAQPMTEAVIVSVCDQPFLTTAVFERILAEPHALAACRYKKSWGVPACFTKPFFSEVLALGDDEGAKKILTRHRDLVEWIPFPQGDFDVDTPADLDQLQREFPQ